MGDRSLLPDGYVTVELFYSGAWQDVTAYLGDAGVTIERRAEVGGKVVPSQCTLTLANADGRFSPRNPRSPLFGLIGRNTPLRVTADLTGTPSVRFVGEVAEWPQRWSPKGAPSAYAEVVAAGFTRRLGQGASPLRSPIRRAISTVAASTLVGYWPLEDPDGAASFASALDGHKAATWTGTPTLGAFDGFACSEPLPTLGSASIKAVVPAHTATGEAAVRWLSRVPAGPADGTVLLRIYCTGALATVDVTYRTGGGDVTVTGYNRDGDSVGAATYDWNFDGDLLRASIDLVQDGADVDWTFATIEVGDTSGLAGGGTFTGVTLGRVRVVEVNPNRAAFGDTAVGHLTVENDVTSLFTVSTDVLKGYDGELAHERVQRLCTENGLTGSLVGARPDAEAMGAQGVDTLLALVDEAAEVGQGLVVESRTAESTLRCITLETLYALTPTLDVGYVDNLFRPFEPTDDDDGVRNKVTVQRAGGTAATVEDVDSALGTAAVGIYDAEETLSLDLDVQARQHAAWRVARGTHDEARWPVVGVNLRDSYWLDDPTATDDALAVDVGSRIDISDLPSWLPPDDVRLLVVGYVEQLGTHDYEIEWQCVPWRPFAAAMYTDDADSRYDTAGCTLAEDLDATETTVTVNVGRTAWGHADGDYPIVVGGERMTVTAVGAASTTQDLTVVRSVNGVTKTHLTGAAVELAEPKRNAL